MPACSAARRSTTRDGFIHFSTAAQVRGDRRASISPAPTTCCWWRSTLQRSAGALRWEPSRGGALFPHLYGALPLAAVLWAKPLPLGADGRHVFPELDAVIGLFEPLRRGRCCACSMPRTRTGSPSWR